MSKSWTIGSAPEGAFKKIIANEYNEWDRQYWNNPGTKRYGAAFLEALFPHVDDPELFYDDQPLRAMTRIEKFYLVQES
jgi:hypothetical protein